VRLQARLDGFKADFEAGKPPYNVSLSVVETMHVFGRRCLTPFGVQFCPR
jgi:hypothetical protein